MFSPILARLAAAVGLHVPAAADGVPGMLALQLQLHACSGRGRQRPADRPRLGCEEAEGAWSRRASCCRGRACLLPKRRRNSVRLASLVQGCPCATLCPKRPGSLRRQHRCGCCAMLSRPALRYAVLRWATVCCALRARFSDPLPAAPTSLCPPRQAVEPAAQPGPGDLQCSQSVLPGRCAIVSLQEAMSACLGMPACRTIVHFYNGRLLPLWGWRHWDVACKRSWCRVYPLCAAGCTC